MSIDQAAMNFINQHNAMKIAKMNAGVTKYGIDTRAGLEQQNIDARKKLFDMVTLSEENRRKYEQAAKETVSANIVAQEDYNQARNLVTKAYEQALEKEADTPFYIKPFRWASRLMGFTPTIEEMFKDQWPDEPQYDYKNLGPQHILNMRLLGIGQNVTPSSTNEDLMKIINNYQPYQLESQGGVQE
tara:strand:+ start:8049 stop:8609 length:561 start_codon:yes stop_codon:yes gene_type:complete